MPLKRSKPTLAHCEATTSRGKREAGIITLQ